MFAAEYNNVAGLLELNNGTYFFVAARPKFLLNLMTVAAFLELFY